MKFDIDIFQSMKDHNLEKNGFMIVESQKAVSKLLKTNKKIHCFLCLDKEYNRWESLLDPGVQIIRCNQEQINSLVGYSVHKGVMALTDRPSYAPLANLNGPIVALNGVTSPENVGAIVRTMIGLGFSNLLIDSKSCSPYLRRCMRVSTGNALYLNVSKSENFVADLGELGKTKNICITAGDKSGTFAHKHKFKKETVLIMGSEGHGVEQELYKLASTIINLPVSSETEHYNVSNATTMLLYEWARQSNFATLAAPKD